MTKVYCENCKYCYSPNIDGFSIHSYCEKTHKTIDTPVCQSMRIKTCEEAKFNSDNSCRFYERKWWKFWIKD